VDAPTTLIIPLVNVKLVSTQTKKATHSWTSDRQKGIHMSERTTAATTATTTTKTKEERSYAHRCVAST